eukprot:CAMPEP_0177661430 /NCGR_PEP_ID=MMETSP0447-20121125/18677_1 /TAXON_ID=0 /ORGANISM="Stygamoeba regulata, Strain BSH-02190019" /LENGTH=376 /DNA_ID=CAMNT_0019166777 /DNA_START=61 /DNA_END=1192 /DNA_ORIENTATION=-
MTSTFKLGLTKQITRPGTGPLPSPNSRVSVHFVGTLDDGTVFDTTRERKRALQFTIGAEQTIPGLEAAVATMHEGERALVVCEAPLAFGAMGNPMGFHGVGKPIPKDARLSFDVELVHIDDPSTVSGKDRNDKDRMRIAAQRKQEANQAFSEKRYDAAITKYALGIAELDQAPVGQLSDEEHVLLIQLYNNISLSYLATDQYTQVVEFATKAIEAGAKTIDLQKALFRRGKAHVALKSFDDARSDLGRALTLCETDAERKVVQRVRQSLAALEKQAVQKEKAFFNNMFKAMEKKELYTEKELEERRKAEEASKPPEIPPEQMERMYREQMEAEAQERVNAIDKSDPQWARKIIKKYGKKKETAESDDGQIDLAKLL